jgi:HEAT repeat protein
MKHNKSLIRLLGIAAFTAACIAISAPAIAGRGATRAEVAGTVRNGNVDAIIAVLEKAENMVSTTTTIELVEGLLQHQDYRAREVAAWWFARRAAHKTRLSLAAKDTLAGSDSIAIRNAADMLGTFRHPRAVTLLSQTAARTDINTEARVAAVRALGTIGHPAANSALGAAMTDGDAGVRIQAVTAWAEIRHQDNAVPLVPLLSDGDVAVRRLATAVVGKYAEASARADLEQALLNDPDALVRRNAAYALGQIGDRASRDVLAQAAENDESTLVRAYAMRARGMVGF